MLRSATPLAAYANRFRPPHAGRKGSSAIHIVREQPKSRAIEKKPEVEKSHSTSPLEVSLCRWRIEISEYRRVDYANENHTREENWGFTK